MPDNKNRPDAEGLYLLTNPLLILIIYRFRISVPPFLFRVYYGKSPVDHMSELGIRHVPQQEEYENHMSEISRIRYRGNTRVSDKP